MARKPTVHFPGALYYVMCPGNQRQSKFKDDPDRGLGKLAEELDSNRERGVLETLCGRLRKGRRPKRSIRLA